MRDLDAGPAASRLRPADSARPPDRDRATICGGIPCCTPRRRDSAWARWFSAAGAPGLVPVRHLELDHTYLQLQAAVDGLGVALGSLPLIEADIAAGRLVCPLAAPELRDDDYQLVIAEDRRRDPAIKAFRSWILAAAEGPSTGIGTRRPTKSLNRVRGASEPKPTTARQETSNNEADHRAVGIRSAIAAATPRRCSCRQHA